MAPGLCILILYEATSNLGPTTEGLIQKVIDEEFRENTVITVAHRLSTVGNVDTVVLLEKRKVDRIGLPRDILAGMS
ncbi:hypothetical protein EJ08DRAFT_332962 [Tothia fuscella]|uniref:Uncharacterized protein n=1 Tax=Tothia fuscella TaxID=1048955 RepID=A0A9P4NMR2_9PEZI|nr:hypothetical protein EJ08DRAFT_332962 [Tothia fuscella]